MPLMSPALAVWFFTTSATRATLNHDFGSSIAKSLFVSLFGNVCVCVCVCISLAKKFIQVFP